MRMERCTKITVLTQPPYQDPMNDGFTAAGGDGQVYRYGQKGVCEAVVGSRLRRDNLTKVEGHMIYGKFTPCHT